MSFEHTSKEYRAWARMIQRCTNPNHDNYHRYGGRGIRVCQRWLESFENFLADLGRAPTSAHTIDRRENDGDYEPGNCRWATRVEQANNRSTSLLIRHRGLEMTMAEWAKYLGLSRKCLWKRLKLRAERPEDWPLDRVLSPYKRADADEYPLAA